MQELTKERTKRIEDFMLRTYGLQIDLIPDEDSSTLNIDVAVLHKSNTHTLSRLRSFIEMEYEVPVKVKCDSFSIDIPYSLAEAKTFSVLYDGLSKTPKPFLFKTWQPPRLVTDIKEELSKKVIAHLFNGFTDLNPKLGKTYDYTSGKYVTRIKFDGRKKKRIAAYLTSSTWVQKVYVKTSYYKKEWVYMIKDPEISDLCSINGCVNYIRKIMNEDVSSYIHDLDTLKELGEYYN